MNNKLSMCLYYLGLLLGILFINFVFHTHKEYADCIMEGFQNLKQIDSIGGQDLFFYLFVKRGKQILFIFLLYFQLSKHAALFILEFCFAFLTGLFLSLCTFYYNIGNAICMSVILIPQFFGFLLLKKMGQIGIEIDNVYKKINFTNLCSIGVIVTIILIIVELAINFKAGQRIFTYK
ncbi:MAG: hypothetical protein E7253_09005 [Lachnospiraceae bacterium]|nr:hypothetical protein [Lachnospiraceae bacterium]